jgi:hypothetical protein
MNIQTKDISKREKAETEISEEELERLRAAIQISPSWSATGAIINLLPKTDGGKIANALREQIDQVLEGDLSRSEAMLITQAHVLQEVFTNFTSRTANAEYLSQAEAYSKIALRAQNQCQRTLKTLLKFKTPKRTTFIKQQNNATNQQVNEGKLKEIPEKEINPANELLEENHEARLDTGKKKETVRTDSEVETVGELDRTRHGTG